jgi:hypothetical protein
MQLREQKLTLTPGGSSLNMIFGVTDSDCLAQYVICGVVSQTLDVNSTLFAIPLDNYIELHHGNYCHLPSDFFFQISIIHDNSSSQVGDKRKVGFWPMDELIHDKYLQTYS